MQILKKVGQQLKKEYPFVIYRKSNRSDLSAFFGKNKNLKFTKDYSESGFVFAPFDECENSILFSIDEFEYLSEQIVGLRSFDTAEFQNVEKAEGKRQYLKLVDKAIAEIHKNTFQKVVISRKETFVSKEFDAVTVFKRLLSSYQNALVYLWYHPEVGLWMGASPETLFKKSGSQLTTVALAGTKPSGNYSKDWGSKEIEEQQLVVDFIEKSLSNKVDNLQIQDRQTIQAGSISHLKSIITAELKKGVSLRTVIQELHPTPAVCGLPKIASKAFILQNENYKRLFYTGFLGELNFDSISKKESETHLFVNLRCLEYSEETLHIYVGGGITKDSNPEKEWLETVNKTKTIKSVL